MRAVPRAKVCLLSPDGRGGYEHACEVVCEVTPDGRGPAGEARHRALFPADLGVEVGWLVILLHAYRVESLTPRGRWVEAGLVRPAG